MTPTPRTDAQLFDPVNYYDQGGSSYGQMKRAADGDYVPVELAHQLERELAETRKALEESMSYQRELRADRDRLDWLERPQQITQYVNPFRDVVHRTNSGQTLREAIDAAMEAGS
jgi:hypothetical protein